MPADDSPQYPERAPERVVEQLWKSRTLLLFGEITMQLAQALGAQLLALAASGDEPIRLLINSPGGHVEAGDTLHDLLRFVGPKVFVVGTGWVASAAALVYVGVERQNRFALPNTRFLLHEPRGGASGQASDVENRSRAGAGDARPPEPHFCRGDRAAFGRIARETQRNHWMGAQAAVEYGLVGRIVERTSDLPRP
ncbi:MAG: ATP-dependent Clp protease proteolytic subunit [Polyangiaceae bacterium]